VLSATPLVYLTSRFKTLLKGGVKFKKYLNLNKVLFKS
jgi:hypothetical protein